jgi:hypothetical protein
MVIAAAASVLMGSAANAAWYTASYEADYLPQDPLSAPQWQKYFDGTGTVADGVLTVTTDNTSSGDGPYLEYRLDGGGAWNPTGAGTTVEMRYKVNFNDPTGEGWAGSFMLGTGERYWSAKIGTNFITVVGAGDFYLPSIGIDASTYHTYRFTTANDTGNLDLYVDGAVTPAHSFVPTVATLSRLAFGDLGAPEGGQVAWDYIRWTNAGVVIPTGPAWAVNASGDWNAAGNWGGTPPNGVDAKAMFLDAITSAKTVFTDTPVVAGEVKFDNANTYQIAGNGNLSIDVSTGSGSISVVQGTHKINLPLFINDNTTADIAAGATLKISDPMTLVGGSTLSKIGDGTLSIEAPVSNAAPATIAMSAGVTNALMDLGNNTSVNVSGGVANLKTTQHLSALSVSGGSVKIGPGTGVVVSTKSLAISGSGQVDLQNSKMIVDYTGSSVIGDVKTAVNAGSLTSSQLTSGRAIGYGEASDLFAGPSGSFAGETVDSTSIVMAYTVVGDASLDGTVNSADFNQFVAGYGTLANARWTQGDFNGDGKVTTVDFNVLAGQFGQSLPAATLGSVVPEPATGALVSVLLLGLARRRKI